jgi:hypothetical protein
MKKVVILLAVLLLVVLVVWWLLGERSSEQPRKQSDEVLAYDGFDGKLSLEWDILHPDPSHYSLTNRPGCLTITTQQGGFADAATDYGNLFLIDCPKSPGKHLEVTARLSFFRPVANWNQAGLVLYNDDDNYLTWGYGWSDGLVFGATEESEGYGRRLYFTAPPVLGDLWLRVTKAGNIFEFSISLDGSSFFLQRVQTWDKTVKHVGLFASNGPGSTAPQIDASFDSFQVGSFTVKAAPAVPTGFIVPEENRIIPQGMETCAVNLRRIHGAIKKYQKDKGELPDWLSDLVPGYISAQTLRCPAYPEHTARDFADRRLPCSYEYPFTPTPHPRGWLSAGLLGHAYLMQQTHLYGDVHPMVRCSHHGLKMVLNVSVGGEVYWSYPAWEWLFVRDGRNDSDTFKVRGAKRLLRHASKASWSPDGKAVVFAESRGRGVQIYDLSSGKRTDLTTSGRNPAWSPDGRFIAYVSQPDPNVSKCEEVWLVRPTVESPRKLADGGFPSWSADGKTLFVHSRKENKILGIDVDNPGAEPKVVFDRPQSLYPAFSPDGKRIAFGKQDALAVVDRESGQTVLTWPVPGTRGLLSAWSPDGNLIAFGGFADDVCGLWVLNVKTRQAVQVTWGPYTMPAWSNDGSQLAFDLRSSKRQVQEIWMVETKALDTLKPLRPPPARPTRE